MWITEEVNLPVELVQAQEANRLVIFAGAGISLNQPSNLPLFDELAEKISAGALTRRIRDGEKEPVDRYLGRLQNQGVQVYERAKRLIGDPSSQPTKLHRDLISLFPMPEETRIVTTNFDRHFTNAAMPGTILHYAPALPLGRMFNGIVYLHGSVEREARDLVLTDSDFGRAYLTDGWATRFLWELFSEYVVLFIGYSHNDPVMHYLSRGLAPEKAFHSTITGITPPIQQPLLRYALTEPGRNEHWEFLGIRPIDYPIHNDGKDHSALDRVVSAWVDLSKTTWIGNEERIQSIVMSGVPDRTTTKGLIDEDYLLYSLRSPEKARFFTSSASGIDWLQWIEQNGLLNKLFSRDSNTSMVDDVFARWLAEHYAIDHTDACLALFARHNQIINKLSLYYISQELAWRSPSYDSSVMSKWITVLLGFEKDEMFIHHLAALLKNMSHPDDNRSAILLLSHLTQPVLVLQERRSWYRIENDSSIHVNADIKLRGGKDSFFLENAWKEYFLPNMEEFYQELFPIFIGHITQAYAQLYSIRQLESEYDPLSFHRHAIEDHEQDKYQDDPGLLITMLRDIIDWMNNHLPTRAISVADELADSTQRLLKRIAVHIIIENRIKLADDKIQWLLDRGWLTDIYMRHEVFRLLAVAFPLASESIRQRALDTFEAYITDASSDPIEGRDVYYEYMNLLVWLKQYSPNDKLVAERLVVFSKIHPEYIPPKHPDLLSYTEGGFVAHISPVSIDEMLLMSIREVIKLLLTFEGHWSSGPSREALLGVLTEAVNRDFTWSIQIADSLLKSNQWIPDVWSSLISGWSQSLTKKSQWSRVIGILEKHGDLISIGSKAAELLRKAAGQKDKSLPIANYGQARRFAHHLLKVAMLVQHDEVITKDAYQKAWGSISGKVTEFWIFTIVKRRNARSGRIKGIGTLDKKFLMSIIDGIGYDSMMGRLILSSHVSLLFHIDPIWTGRNIVPLFNCSKHQLEALMMWDGIRYTKLNKNIIPLLMPMLRTCFKLISDFEEEEHKWICELLSYIAIHIDNNPIEEGWLWEFLFEVDDNSRVLWSDKIPYNLEIYGRDNVKGIWCIWMKDYWDYRNTGVPIPFSLAEKGEMLNWIWPLEQLFPEVVKLFCATPSPDFGPHSILFKKLYDSPIIDKYPIDMAFLVLHLLSNKSNPLNRLEGDVAALTIKLADNGVEPSILFSICEEMARLGDSKASEVKARISEHK